jgi:hypothetical protein
MSPPKSTPVLAGLGVMSLAIAALTSAAPPWFTWSTVVNNNDLMPTEGCANDPAKCKPFNSYNQPSVNLDGLVVIRARSRGGPGETGGSGNEGGFGGGTGGGGAGSGMGGITVSAGGGGGSSGSDTDHGNQPVHGIYTRDMSAAGSSIVKILDRKTAVPQPNNLAHL